VEGLDAIDRSAGRIVVAGAAGDRAAI